MVGSHASTSKKSSKKPPFVKFFGRWPQLLVRFMRSHLPPGADANALAGMLGMMWPCSQRKTRMLCGIDSRFSFASCTRGERQAGQ
jgi:hypothetical protein